MRNRQQHRLDPHIRGKAPRYCEPVTGISVPQRGQASTAWKMTSLRSCDSPEPAISRMSPGFKAERGLSSTRCRREVKSVWALGRTLGCVGCTGRGASTASVARFEPIRFLAIWLSPLPIIGGSGLRHEPGFVSNGIWLESHNGTHVPILERQSGIISSPNRIDLKSTPRLKYQSTPALRADIPGR